MTTFSRFSEVLEKDLDAFGSYATFRPLEIVTSWSLILLFTDEEIFRSLFDGN